MAGLYVIIIMLFGMYLFLALTLTKISRDNDNLKKENKHLEMRINSLMDAVRLLNKEINNKTSVVHLMEKSDN